MSARYAVYFDPAPGSELDRFGRWWFAPDGPPALSGFNQDRLAEIQASARHYGFHATLKAPFALADRCDERDLRAALADFARARAPLVLPPLQPTRLGPYLVLRPAEAAPELEALAADCVRFFEAMRAPLSESDIVRRRRARLTPRQDALLLQWGYPYVMEEFRFHMTLGGPLEPGEMDRAIAALAEPLSGLSRSPFVLDRLSLYFQPDRVSAFGLLASAPFAAGASHRAVAQ